MLKRVSFFKSVITLRNCFKYRERRHIEFCLDSKFGAERPSTVELANFMGLSKQNRLKTGDLGR